MRLHSKHPSNWDGLTSLKSRCCDAIGLKIRPYKVAAPELGHSLYLTVFINILLFLSCPVVLYFVMMGGRSSAIAAGVGAALFVGYCIYFDKKRRSDPNYKNKLRERRRKQKAAQEKAGLSRLPDLKDAEAVQKFFLEEIQLGEELLAQGDYEKGVDHLTNAIAVCGQPQQLLQVLQQTLPPPVFQMLLTKLPTISQRIVSAQSVSDDDIE